MNASNVDSVWIYDPWCFTPWYSAELVLALKHNIHDVRLVSPRYYLEPDYFSVRGIENDPGPIDITSGAKYLSAPVRRGLRLWEWGANTLALSARLYRNPVKIVHVQQCVLLSHGVSWELDFIDWVKHCGARVVHTVHNLLPHASRSSHHKQYQKLYRNCDALICHTDDVGQSLKDDFEIPAEKIEIIPHGPLFSNHLDLDRMDCRREIGIGNGGSEEIVFLWQGVIAPYKGVDLLLQAWEKLYSTFERNQLRARLLVAGNGPDGEICKLRSMLAQMKSQESIDLHIGYIPASRIPLYYQSSDVLIYPYRNITTSGALMTGLNYRKPIVATELPAFESVLDHEKNALLVAGPTVLGLADAILRIIQSPKLYSQLAENAQANPKKQIQWNEIAAQTELVYQRLVQNH